MACKFYEGQKVVAIVDHSQGDFKKDEEFTVLHIDHMCGSWLIKIRDDDRPTVYWCKHNNAHFFNGRHYNQKCFAPAHDIEMGEMSFDDAIKLTTPKKEIALEEIK
jgi:hypothetical protein